MFGVTGAAYADPLVFSPLDPMPISRAGSAYVSLGGGAIVQQLPTFNTPYVINGTNQTLFSVSPAVTGGAGQITLGSVINGLPTGNNSRIELSVGGFSGSGRFTGGLTTPDTTVLAISGTGIINCGGCDGTTTLKFDYQEIGGVLRLKSDFALAPQLTATPSIGILASQSKLGYRSDTGFQFAPAFNVPAFVEETVETFRAGGEFGLNFGYRATQQLSFNAGATVALLAMSSSLNGNDCLSSNQPIGMPCSGALIRSSVTQTDRRFDNRDRFNLSGTYDTGWMKFTLAGFGSWDSAMPGVTNPVVAGMPAIISYESRWSYGGSAALTVPFNVPK
jgi:hypothetical protein